MASGVEVAGLVLGSFPIILNCLDYYREGLEPLEEWWNFRRHFIAFVDSIRHQMMRYNENMTRLLDPIITDNDRLVTLIQNHADPRWKDGTLDEPLDQRLGSERDRFFRVVERMNKVVDELKRLLEIDGDRLPRIGPAQQTSWAWQFTRMNISFSRGKHKKVRKLADYNQELQEILGYSERVIPIADKRKSSDPVMLFEKLRQHACSLHSALTRRWKCHTQKCQSHEAHLSICVNTRNISSGLLFIVGDDQEHPHTQHTKQEVIVQPVQDALNAASAGQATKISHVQQAASFVAVQEQFETVPPKSKSTVRSLVRGLKKAPLEPASAGKHNTTTHPKVEKKRVNFANISIPTIEVTDIRDQTRSLSQTSDAKPIPPQIADLCSFLREGQSFKIGVVIDEYDRQLEFSKPLSKLVGVLDMATLVSLPELLDAHHTARIDISRQNRFEMAAHVASALLQAHMSPWLSKKWSKHDFSFLVHSNSLCSPSPYVSRTYLSSLPGSGDTATSAPPMATLSEEETRVCLFTVGVMILELIFGHNIEACRFRKNYYGPDSRPNDQTDISTAKLWSKKVVGECGADVADVVRRCLDCSFGPKPILSDVRFKEAVYEGVIRPLVDYSKVWPEVKLLS